MACLCEKIAGKDIDLSPTCIGHLWIFQNLEAEEIESLSREALRKKSTTGQALFMQGDLTDEMFLIKGGLVKLSKVLEAGTELTLDIRKAGDFVGENMLTASIYQILKKNIIPAMVPKIGTKSMVELGPGSGGTTQAILQAKDWHFDESHIYFLRPTEYALPIKSPRA